MRKITIETIKSFNDYLINEEKAVQIEFPWLHANLGDVMIRFSGKRVKNIDGMIILQGYCRVIADVIGA